MSIWRFCGRKAMASLTSSALLSLLRSVTWTSKHFVIARDSSREMWFFRR